MNLPAQGSRTPFIIVLILLLAMTGVQFFFNFRGLTSEAAMDQAQIARNVASGEGLTTKMARPIQMVNDSNHAGINPYLSEDQLNEQKAILASQGEQLVNPERFNPHALKDTRYAPLNTLVEALIFKVSGVHQYDLWQIPEDAMIYLPDRIVAGISALFFILSVLSCYYVLNRMFDTTIAGFTCLTMILSNLFLQYATSGLPQMLMLLFFTWGVYFLYIAMQREREQSRFLQPLIYSSICFSCVCLAGWIGLWPMAGFLIFVGIRFKPHGLYCLPAIAILLLCIAYPVYFNKSTTGSVFGTAYYTICTGMLGDEGGIMRALIFGDLPISTQGAVTGIIDNLISQFDSLYTNLGNLPLALIFLVALLHTFKKQPVNQIKWGIFAMWVMAAIGMALYTPGKQPLSLGQIHILFAPFFTAYGTAFVLNLTSRHSKEVAPILRGSVLLLALLVTALPLMLSLPQIIRVGILTAQKGIPAWPPYYPQGITRTIHDQTAADDFILTDQPAAISWYANRKTMGIPRMADQFDILERILHLHGGKVGSILVTPSSSMNNDVKTVASSYGDFTPFVMEGFILTQTKDKNPVYLLNHSKPLSNLIQRFGQPDSRQFIMGAEMILYKEEKPTEPPSA